jgi:low affinity Fe/Cu permease
MVKSKKGGLFDRFAKMSAAVAGRPVTFIIAVVIIVVWAATGPMFQFNDTWQLVINTSTTIITFLMVFLIQNTQNRDGHALQLKLDELIRATKGAHVALLDMEELTEEELMKIKECFTRLAEKGREDLEQGTDDTDTPMLNLESFGHKA